MSEHRENCTYNWKHKIRNYFAFDDAKQMSFAEAFHEINRFWNNEINTSQ